MMKKKLLAALVAMAPVLASAADLTINFSGKIDSQTCTISSATGNSMAVAMGTVSTTQFRAAGDIAGTTPFTIKLTGCPSGVTKVAGVFEAGGGVDATNGYLKPGGDGRVTGLAIRLLDSTHRVIRADGGTATQMAVSGSNADLQMYAQYISTASAVTAGTIATSVAFSILYN